MQLCIILLSNTISDESDQEGISCSIIPREICKIDMRFQTGRHWAEMVSFWRYVSYVNVYLFAATMH